MKNYHAIFCCCLLLLLTFTASDASAQSRRNRRGGGPVYGARVEKQVSLPDSATLARRDSLRHVDSLRRADSVAILSKSSLEVPAFSHAADSMVSDFSNGQRRIHYYGSTSVKYQDMELTADYMEYDMNAGTVYARGVYDSLDGVWNGQPVMKQGNQTYNMEEVRYNFNTRKARIKNMVTNDSDGILHGRDIKMMDDHSINLEHGKYTVCDEEHPHYYVSLSLGKVISQTKTTVFGPAGLVIEDVHLPIGLPFGFIPKRPQRATGLLMPSFGEEQERGFYMRDLGMYFVFGDHFDVSLTGSYYTLGTWSVDLNSRYRVNYKYNGSLGLTYSHDVVGEKGSPDYSLTTNFRVQWTHSMDSKAHPGTTFSASVDFSTPRNNRFNSHSLNEAMENQAHSSISWGHNWNGKYNLRLTASHSQNSRTENYTFTLPNLTFTVSTFYPFKRKNRVGKERFYEKFALGYTTTLQNKVSFNASEFKKDTSTTKKAINPDVLDFNADRPLMDRLLDKFSSGMDHNFTINLPGFQLFKYISVSPDLRYSQVWFFKKAERAYNAKTKQIEAMPSHQFNTLGITQTYSGGISMSTRLYGTFNFGKHHRVQAVRHVISPSLSFNVSPNLETYANGYRTLTITGEDGKEKTYKYNIYDFTGHVGSIPSGGRRGSLNLSIGNNLEAKVRDFADTTGTGTKKVKLIEQLTISTGYNFLAEQFKMSNVNVSFSTKLFDLIPINGGMTFDPYSVDKDGMRVDRFAVREGQGLARMTEFHLSMSYSISGKGALNGYDGTGQNGRGSTAGNYYQQSYYHPVTGEYIPGGWLYYFNPNAPWSLNISSTISNSIQYKLDEETQKLIRKNNFRATMNLTGNIKLTPKMSINLTSGYDFIAKQLTTCSLNASYDLHCFNIAVSWIPAGHYKSYSFRIAANASALADLLRFKRSDSSFDYR